MACVVVSLIVFETGASAIYVMGSGDTSTDANVISVLGSFGHTASLGAQFYEMDGTEDFSSYDAIYLQNSYNWDQTMQAATAENIADFVNAGGGLVTAEWTVWSSAAMSGWDPISAILPVTYSTYTYPTLCTFTEESSDATINYNLSSSFDFVPSDSDGSFTKMDLKSGATQYYSATTDADGDTTVGMAGWDVGTSGGRVFSFSVILGADELIAGTPTAQLLGNSFAWTTDVTPTVPEPASVALIGVVSTAGLFIRRRFFP